MKKLLLSLATVALGLSASGATVTFDFKTGDAIQEMNSSVTIPTSEGTDVNGVVFSLDGVDITGAQGTASTPCRIWKATNNLQYRVYKGGSITISSKNTLTNVTITSSAGAFTVNGTSTKTWSGSANSVKFDVTTNAQITAIDVTYEGNGGTTDPGTDPDPGEDDPVTPPTGDLTPNPVTFDFIKNDYGMTRGDNNSYNTNPTTVTQYPIDVTFNGGNNRLWSDGMRFYSGSYFTISSTSEANPIIQVVVNYKNATAANAFALDNSSTGSYSKDGAVGTWTGNASSVRINYTATSSQQAVSSIVVTYYEEGKKQPAALSFSASTATVSIGEEDFADVLPTLENPNGVEVTYSSSDDSVATVDASTGAVTLVGGGETTIKATFAGNEKYEEGEASYVLTVLEPITGTLVFIDWSNNCPSELSSDTNNAGGVNIEDPITQDIVTVTAAKNDASTAPRWWYVAAGNQARFYANNTLTFSVPEGYQLTGLEFITKTNNFNSTSKADTGTFDSGIWTPEKSTSSDDEVREVVITFGSGVYVTGTNVYYDISTGVSSIVSDSEVAPVYYNLQGVRVANPEKGLYIVVKGGKSQKVIF